MRTVLWASFPTAMSEIRYHLEELEIQRDPNDPRRLLPAIAPGIKSVLDVGCGIGQTLMASQLGDGILACGVDVDEAALRHGASLTPWVRFVRAGSERLPFADGSFDMVFSRAALPWMHIPTALGEISRVTKPGGRVWLSLVDADVAWRELRAAILRRSPRQIAFRAYTLLNGALFHLTGTQFRYPLKRSRCESFQTAGGMLRAMRRAGFVDVRAERAHTLVITAEKPGH
jgi:ubiquinone/menaquinone biosynthesis C-methylase UbiE